MPASCDIELQGEHLQLLAGRALFWPARRLLAIADIHLGKDDVFRHAGIAVPAGVAGTDLDRLSAQITLSGATRLLVLGDFIHGTRGVATWRETWHAFRARHDIRVDLVMGNHDRGLDTQGLDVHVIDHELLEGPFCFRHDHQPDRPGFCISGHVHPVVRLSALNKRFPVFHLSSDGLSLPAFSAMTGGWKVASSGAWVACVADQVIVSPALKDMVAHSMPHIEIDRT